MAHAVRKACQELFVSRYFSYNERREDFKPVELFESAQELSKSPYLSLMKSLAQSPKVCLTSYSLVRVCFAISQRRSITLRLYSPTALSCKITTTKPRKTRDSLTCQQCMFRKFRLTALGKCLASLHSLPFIKYTFGKLQAWRS
jgi:hypothetical protein